MTTLTGTYFVSILPDSLNPWVDRPRYTIRSSADVNGHTRSLELDVQVQTFTDFLYFTDREHQPGNGNPLWFHTGDLVDGPLFTNDQLSIMGDPRFLGLAISAYGGPGDNGNHSPLILYYNNDRHHNIESSAPSNPPYDMPEFADGYVLGAPQIIYPSHSLTGDLRDVAQDGGIALSGNYEFYLSRPSEEDGSPMYGTVSYRKNGHDWDDSELSSFNGIIYVNGSLSVQGTLDGQLTLVSSGSIDITDDLLYRDGGEDGPGVYCNDMLGLVAGTDINVVNNAANQDDCVINAAMIVLNSNASRSSVTFLIA